MESSKILFLFYILIAPTLSLAQTKVYGGTINDKYEIKLFIKPTSKSVEGFYFYESQDKLIRLGTLSSNDESIYDAKQLCLSEGDRNIDPPNERGFCGHIYDNQYKGKWHDYDESYPFIVDEVFDINYIFRESNDEFPIGWKYSLNENTNNYLSIHYIINDLYVYDFEKVIIENNEIDNVIYREGIIKRVDDDFYSCDLNQECITETPLFQIRNEMLYSADYIMSGNYSNSTKANYESINEFIEDYRRQLYQFKSFDKDWEEWHQAEIDDVKIIKIPFQSNGIINHLLLCEIMPKEIQDRYYDAHIGYNRVLWLNENFEIVAELDDFVNPNYKRFYDYYHTTDLNRNEIEEIHLETYEATTSPSRPREVLLVECENNSININWLYDDYYKHKVITEDNSYIFFVWIWDVDDGGRYSPHRWNIKNYSFINGDYMLTDSLSTKSKLDSWNPDFDLILETAIRENSDDFKKEVDATIYNQSFKNNIKYYEADVPVFNEPIESNLMELYRVFNSFNEFDLKDYNSFKVFLNDDFNRESFQEFLQGNFNVVYNNDLSQFDNFLNQSDFNIISTGSIVTKISDSYEKFIIPKYVDSMSDGESHEENISLQNEIYQIVCGKYVVKKNAIDIVTKLEKANYSNVDVQLTNDNFYKVVVNGFKYQSAAESSMNRIQSLGIDAYVVKINTHASNNLGTKSELKYSIKDGIEFSFNESWSAAPKWVNEAFEQQNIDFKGNSSDIMYVLYPNERFENEEFDKYPYITISYLELNTDLTNVDYNEMLQTVQGMLPSLTTLMNGFLSDYLDGTSMEGFYKDVDNRRYAYSTISKVIDIGDVLTINLNQYTSTGLIRISFTCLKDDHHKYRQDVNDLLIGLD